MEKLDLDEVLMSIGGWGKFQTLTYISLCFVVTFSVFPMSYIFVARDTKYRCQIESCNEEPGVYNPKWLKNAVPYNENTPSRCFYYEPEDNTTCTNFQKNKTLTCHNHIYERNQTTIVQDFKITCDENLWKLTMVGTINELGELCCLALVGFFSDRFGRKSMLMVSATLSTIAGLLRSFSSSYHMYIALEFLDTALGSGMYSGAFILALELVESRKRNRANTIMCCAFALGQVLLGTAAWASPSWRIMLRFIYTFGILVVISLWFVPESIRWLISKNKTEEAWNVLKSVSAHNGTTINRDISDELTFKNNLEERIGEKEAVSFIRVLKSKTLLVRTIHCSYTWICCNFPYYGLNIQSMTLSEDIYVNFMFTSLIEVPAYFVTQGTMDRFGRKKTLGFSLIFAGVACISVDFAGTERWSALVVFLSGKFFITVAYTTLYIYTAEMFPTKARHSIFAICSMFGRLGTMLAPQVPLLTRVFKTLPLIIFSAMTLSSGLLAFWFPETLNTKLPDEIDEAVNIEVKNS